MTTNYRRSPTGAPAYIPGDGEGGGLGSWTVRTTSDFSYAGDFYGVRAPGGGGNELESSGDNIVARMNRANGGGWWSRSWLHQGPPVSEFEADTEQADGAKILQVRIKPISITGLDGTVLPYIMVGYAASSNPANRGAGFGMRWLADGTQRLLATGNQDINTLGAQSWGPTAEDFAAGSIAEIIANITPQGERTAKLEAFAFDSDGNLLINKGTWAFNDPAAQGTHIYLGVGHQGGGSAGNTEITFEVATREFAFRE